MGKRCHVESKIVKRQRTAPKPLPAHEVAFWDDLKHNPTQEKIAEVIDRYRGIIKTVVHKLFPKRAAQIRLTGMEYEDLVQEGVRFLIEKAIPRYDPHKGYQFSTYIFQSLIHELTRIIDERVPMKLPIALRHVLPQVLQAVEEVKAEGVITSSLVDKISEKTGVTTEMITDILLYQVPLSLDVLRYSEEDTSLLDTLMSSDPSPLSCIERKEMQYLLKGAMEKLKLEERQVMEMLYIQEKTVEEVRVILKISTLRVRSIQQIAIRKLSFHIERDQVI